MEPTDLSQPPATVLCVVAHPDDIDFGMAGTVAALTKAGSTVVYAIATSGEAGIPEDMPRAELTALRQAEQRAAGAVVGVTDVRFLGMPDGHLEADLTLRREISRVIRAVKPDLVLTQSPTRRWDRIYASHPDHLAVGEATMAAVYPDARNPHAHVSLLAEGFEPHAVPEVWIGGLTPTDVLIDITDVIDTKAEALASHTSQVGWIEDMGAFVRGWTGEVAVANGMPEGTFAEAWRRIVTT